MPIVRELPQAVMIKYGAHQSFEEGACVMELAAYIAGREHTDSPPCVCPVIASFMRRWNDDLPSDDERTRLLLPLVPKLIDTKATPEAELARVMLCVDWLCREFTPAWLETVPALKHHADTLRAFKPIQSWEDFDAILNPMRHAQQDAAAARDAAWAAALDAARDAAWAAALDAARDAAWAAASAAAWDAALDAALAAASAAAWDAALDAAWAAASAAAWDAAWDVLKPTTVRLQQSAVNLVERMCAIK